MQSIKFDEGYKEFCINDDDTRIVRFNPADYGILERFSEARKTIYEEIDKIEKDIEIKADGTPGDETEDAAKLLSELRKLINTQVDYIFGAPVTDVAFGAQSPISTVGGKFLFERFIEASEKVITPCIKAEHQASQKRIEKYTKQVRR